MFVVCGPRAHRCAYPTPFFCSRARDIEFAESQASSSGLCEMGFLVLLVGPS